MERLFQSAGPGSIFIENLALAFFLGMCTFLAVSKKRGHRSRPRYGGRCKCSSITVPVNNLIFNNLLKDRVRLAWAGLPGVDLSFLGLVSPTSA